MRWSFKRMWAIIMVFAMFSIAFVGVATENQNNAVSLNDSVTTTFSNEGTRGPGAPRVVLMERFTNVGCGPCAPASIREDQFIADHGVEDLAVIKYHTPGPGTDAMYLMNGVPQLDRLFFYSVPYVPFSLMDGVLITDNVQQNGNYPITYSVYQRFYDQRRAVLSPFTVDVDGVLGATTGTVSVNITAVDTVPGGNLKVRLVLYFNNVGYPSPPGSNGESEFDFVFMDFIPDINGMDLTISLGQTVNFIKTFTIPTVIPAAGGSPPIPVQRSQLGIVSMVQDNATREVHQAGVLSFTDLSIDPVGILTTPMNPNLGDTVGISARIINNGEDIDNAYITAYIDQIGGDRIGPAISTGPLLKGQMKVVGIGTWDTTGQPGLRKVFVGVDIDGNFYESDELNNIVSKEVTVAAQFDVGISQIDPFTEGMMYPMSNYSLDGTIKNFGQNAMGDFDVDIQLYELGTPDVPDSTFMDDMEGGPGGWTESGGSWEYGAPSPTPGAHSGTNIWATTLTGNYPLNTVDWLYSPIVAIPSSASSASLSFWHFYSFEYYSNPSPPYDIHLDCGNMWISTDMGVTWTLVEHFRANNGAWNQETYDLTSYVGQSVRFAFELASDRDVRQLGWYIDDFEITSMVPTETLIWNTTTRMSTILASGGVDSLIWNRKIITGGAHKLYVWTPLGGDQNPSNDLMTVTFDIDPTKWRSTLTPAATLISSPLLLTDSSIGNIVAPVQSTISQVRTFDAVSGTWLGYDPTKPANSLSTVDHKMGMWATNPSGGYIDFTGTIPGVTVDIQLEIGWNLVGYPSMTDRTVTDALSTITYDRIEGFDPTGPYHLRELTGNDWMTAGQGYWIHVSSQQMWSVNA
ncbi:MAG: choice-of-anchor J domain-containing protein [Thermoplasmata archaeon]|nr:choice-of-anchor J domain-containing protein [Thermoplasmata archaeon]